MPHQTGHHGDEGRVRLLRQTERCLQCRLARRLAVHAVGGVVLGQCRVVGGVVALRVDAVDNAVELPADGVHHALQPLGVCRVVELGGVGGADGGDGVRHEHGTLHQIHVAVHAEGTVVVPAAVKTEQLIHRVLAVASLIFDVVDGEYRADAPHLRPTGADVLEVDGHQCRLPVVAVENVGDPVQTGQQVDDRLAEEGEPLAVVELAVQPPAAEVFLVVHEVPRHAAILQREQPAILVPPAQIHVDIPAERHLLPPLLPDLVVQGQDDRRLHAVAGECRGQAAGHIRQTAGFTEGVRLACYIKKPHACLLSHVTPSHPW